MKAYRRICKFINVELAKEDLAKEKAFCNSTTGTVLGVSIDTVAGSWKLPPRRKAACGALIEIIMTGEAAQLHQVQQLLGNLETISQMAPFARGFKWNFLEFLRSFGGDENAIRRIPDTVKQDLRLWSRILEASSEGLPLVQQPRYDSLGELKFVSDAAGRPPAGSQDTVGAASLGIGPFGIWFSTAI